MENVPTPQDCNVLNAVIALIGFAGEDITEAEAYVLTSFVRLRFSLSFEDRVAVAQRFPLGTGERSDESYAARRAYAVGYVDGVTGRDRDDHLGRTAAPVRRCRVHRVRRGNR